jgi:hypothetical protein
LVNEHTTDCYRRKIVRTLEKEIRRLIGIGAAVTRRPPSRPGELHPEPLTGPDVSLSTYPARSTLEGCRLPPRPAGSSCCQLTLVDPDAGRLPPSLHGNYPASPLLRSSPPLACASVLSASRFYRLCLFPCHRKPGSQVPYESPDWSHAPCTPDIAWPVSRFPPDCSRNWQATPVLMSSMVFRCVIGGSLALVSPIPT